MAFEIRSTAFEGGSRIPKEHTCEGADRSPDLAWSGAPAETKSFALICDDPDAPGKTWVHWVLWNLPASASTLERDLPKDDALPNGAKQGRNDFGKVGYGGPCPPKGHGDHHYHFKLYALDAPVGLPSGATKAELENAMNGRILGRTEIVGTYSR